MSIESNQPAKQTLVDEGTTLKGEIASTCPLLVNGIVEGALAVPELTISSTGTVKGAISAETVRSEGTIGGSVKAKRVQLSGVVLPNTVIEAVELDLSLGRTGKTLELTFGECEPMAGQLATTEAGVGSANAAKNSPAAANSRDTDSSGSSSSASGLTPS